jgi:hypothetical protein
MNNSTISHKLIEIRNKINNPLKNDVFEVVQKVNEDNNNYQHDDSKFNDLPHFCRNLPFSMKIALQSLKTLHNTPYEFGVSALLGYANSSCQHLYDVDSNLYGVRPISLFITILLGTGGSKSTIHSELKGPIVDYEKHMFDALSNEDMRYTTEDKKYKKDIKKWEDDRDNGVHTPFPDKPKPVETARYIQEKFTVNGLIDTLESQGHVSIISAEAGVFFSSHAFQNMKQDNNRSTEMTTNLTKLWDGDTISRSTRDDYVRLENRRGNILFMVQAHVIKDILNNRMFQEQGFTHRILICQIDDFEKPDMYSTDDIEKINIAKQARQNLQLYLNRLSEILHTRANYVENRDFELQPIVIKLDDDSHNLLAKFYNDNKNIGQTKLEKYEGFANRLHEHTLRIAATIAVYNGHNTVKLTDSQCAIDLINMFIDHRCNLELGVNNKDIDLTSGSELLLSWFKKKCGQEFTKREIRQKGPNSIQSKNMPDKQFCELLEELIKNETVIATEHTNNNGLRYNTYKYNSSSNNE